MYDLSILPSIGRSGLRNSVKVLSGMYLTGWRGVDPSVNFFAGQVAKLGTDSQGQVVVTPVSAVADPVIGMFFTSNSTSFFRPVAKEAHKVGENPASPNTITLNKALIKADTVIVKSKDEQTTYAAPAKYTINLTNGVITIVDIAAETELVISYLYKDITLSGVNQVLGSGKCALVEGVGEISTLVYDSTAAWALGAAVKFTATGLLTVGGASATIGTVTKAPTYDDPSLHVKLNLG